MVDVTHDGDDRRARFHVLSVVKLFGFEVDVEGLEQLTIPRPQGETTLTS